ncbi:extra-large guanine nucleotide-binding protein 1-like [Cornus florida]|uniref:extra-large guanine nucleotide-binding protein 1-like n=1 Tax=Cornus florida TaxID=4283 RepID=UPI00289FB9FE|nr:extra-large guanine nucleotide-binding protein 1-like [Cornus florida]
MTSLLKLFLPVSARDGNEYDGDEYSAEYSFTVEYSGPPVTYDIPRAVPVDIDSIPVAARVSLSNSNLLLPIIPPIAKKSDPLNKKSSMESKLRSGVTVWQNSRGHSGEFFGSSEVAFSDDDALSCKSLKVMYRSTALSLTEGDEYAAPNVADGTGSSGTLGFSDGPEDSHELSGSSDVGALQDDGEVGWDLNKSPLICRTSSEASSCKNENCIDETPCHVNRTSIVTFHCPEPSYVVPDENDHAELEIIQERKGSKTNVMKGLCRRCSKGSRFTKKEVCIVCDAKYCANCVLRAMGSMPEGRKCITCIGLPIDESKRGTLGKFSRMLKRLLTDMEVKLIMRSEVSCEANQLAPELVCVNGKPLCHEELASLQNCQNPPKKLKPGKYWYDKVSGLWGKEGQKPCQIISPQLAVGNPIMQDASNGNTNILINNREITKAELWMLQLARIHCEGSTHFWVSADGTYQEEGQNNLRGRIWDKTGIKLFCALLSLPIPPESVNPCVEEKENLAHRVVLNFIDQKTLNKLLLVGHDKSGTSTIFKQTKIVYNIPFSEDERQNIKLMIQSNLYGYLGILLEGREQFEEDWFNEMRKKHIDQSDPSGNSGQIDKNNIYALTPKLTVFSDWVIQVMLAGNLEVVFPAAIREYAPFVEELWKDGAFQATYNRRNELNMLHGAANYFLNRAVDVLRVDYEPSDTDILYADGITSSNGLASMEFTFPKSTQESFLGTADQNDPLLRYQLIRVHSSSLGESCKWLEMFEDVDLVLYCVALTDYDEFCDDGGVSTNKMLASKKLFESIATHPTLDQKNFLLILNKFDLLKEKIERVPLTQCEWFHDFNPVMSAAGNNSSLAQHAFHYIALKFKGIFRSLTGRNLYVSPVTALEPDSVDEALRYAREILNWDDEKPSHSRNEWSSDSIEASSSS